MNANGSQIINIESGNFSKAPRTDIDIAFDNTTKNPGRYSFEKMFSGGYLGGLCTTALKMAADEGLFSEESKKNVKNLPELTSEEVNKFVSGFEPDPKKHRQNHSQQKLDQKTATKVEELDLRKVAQCIGYG